MLESLNKKYSIAAINIYGTFLLSCIMCYLVSYLDKNRLPSFNNTPIYIAFQNPTFINFSLSINIAMYFPTMVDLVLDWRNNSDVILSDQAELGHDLLLERAFLAVLNVTCASLLLILRMDQNLAYYYVGIHTVQYVGNLGAVLVLCRKLVPKYFTHTNIVGAHLSLAVGSTMAFASFHHSISHWSNIVAFLSASSVFYFLFGRILRPWCMALWSRVEKGKLILSIGETCALWYFISTIFIILLVPAITLAIKLFDVSNSDIYDVYIVLYTFSIYGIVLNTVPGHLARDAVDREKKKAFETKQALVRYMGHEVRSPLNVIMSGLKILQTDVSNLQSSLEEKATLMDTISSMQQESEDLLKTLNNLLLLEKMESSAFSIEDKMVPCADLLDMAKKCTILAQEKGVCLSVRSQVDQKLEYISLCDIEAGGSVDVKEPDLASLYLSIDPLKIGQVIRNLITNAVKFTPSDKTITVTLREATAADLAVAESLAGTEKISTHTSKDKPGWVKLSSYPRYWGYESGYHLGE